MALFHFWPRHKKGVWGQRLVAAAPYPRERPGTDCTGGRVGLRLVWTGAENLAPTGIRSPDRQARRQSLYRLSYPAHIISHYTLKKDVFMSLLICFNEETSVMKLKVAWGPKLPAKSLSRPALGGLSTGSYICQCDSTRQPTVIPNTNHNSTLCAPCIITEHLHYIQQLLLFTVWQFCSTLTHSVFTEESHQVVQICNKSKFCSQKVLCNNN
jgi:hypothetical protein